MNKEEKVCLKFTEETSIAHCNGEDKSDYNYYFISASEHFLNDMLHINGKITLKEVLEYLGFKEDYIRRTIAINGNYIWRKDHFDFVDLDVNPYEKDLGLDPTIYVDVTGLSTD